jgi:GAF domain-containing protein
VDPRRDAPALAKAAALGIPTAADHLRVFAYPVTLILEMTGRPEVLDELLRAKPSGVEVMGAASLRFFWDLLEERARRQREAEVIARVARTINATLDLNTILQQVTDAARELCRADLAQCKLRDPGSDAMVSRYWAGRDDTQDRVWSVEPGKGAGGWVLVTGHPFRTDDYAEDPRITKDYIARVQQVGIIAECVVPIRVGDRIDGLLYVDNVTRRPFTHRDEGLLIQLADHAAVAIQNARLFAESEGRGQAAASLVHLNQVISASLDIETVLREMTQAAVALMHVPGVSLWVADKATQTLERRAVCYEAPIPDFPVQVMRFGEGLVGWIAQHRQIVNVDDAPADARLLRSEWWRAHHLVSFLGIPIESEGELLGVLALIGRQPFRLRPAWRTPNRCSAA